VPSYKRCPFCAEAILLEAKKCKHCGETLDAALRAAEEAARAVARPEPAERRRPEQDRPVRAKRGLMSCGCLFLALSLVAFGIAFGVMRWRQMRALEEADELWDSGQRAAAVAKYKEGYPAAGDDKDEVLRRIVVQELKAGNRQEATKWVERGLNDRLNVNYGSGAAAALLAEVEQERAERDARKQAEAEARAQAKRDQAAAPRKGVTRANYDRIQEGMSLAEVEDILGRGKEGASAGNLRVFTWKGGAIGLRVISISFENDRVVAKAIFD
jgi:hypothetical protein